MIVAQRPAVIRTEPVREDAVSVIFQQPRLCTYPDEPAAVLHCRIDRILTFLQAFGAIESERI